MFTLCLVTLIFSLLSFYLYQVKSHDYWRKKGIPTGSGSHWFFGHYKEVIKSKQHIGVLFQKMYNEYPNAPFVGYYKLNSPAVLVRDPEVIKIILTTDFISFSKNEVFVVDKKEDFLAGNNPFLLDGEEWKTARSHATPLSTMSKLKTYFPNIIDVSHVMINYVNNLCSEKGVAEIETKQLCGKFTTDVVANAFLGIANNTFEDPDSLFATMTREIFSGGILDNFKIIFGMLFPKLSPYLKLRFSSKRTEEILLSLSRRVMKERLDSGVVRNDIFQHMLTLRKIDPKKITDEYVASHCFSFIADGYETSSDVICFTLFELAWNFEVQDNLRKEVNELIKNNEEYGVEEVENLKYLNMVISESLRLHPPGLAMMKLCSKDIKLPKHDTGDYISLKKNTSLAISTYGLHMDGKYFSNPEKFDPERFTEENSLQKYKFVYLPFGDGPRKCLGQRIGLLQVKIAIIKLIEKFRFKPSEKSSYPLRINPVNIVNTPLNGAWVNFEPIK